MLLGSAVIRLAVRGTRDMVDELSAKLEWGHTVLTNTQSIMQRIVEQSDITTDRINQLYEQRLIFVTIYLSFPPKRCIFR